MNPSVRLRCSVPLCDPVGALLEVVQVTATPPTVDTTSTTIGANLDSGTLSRLPVGRRFSDALYLAPGVSTGGNVGSPNPSVEGSTVSRIGTSSTASTSPTAATGRSGRTRSYSARWVTARPTTSCRKSR